MSSGAKHFFSELSTPVWTLCKTRDRPYSSQISLVAAKRILGILPAYVAALIQGKSSPSSFFLRNCATRMTPATIAI